MTTESVLSRNMAKHLALRLESQNPTCVGASRYDLTLRSCVRDRTATGGAVLTLTERDNHYKHTSGRIRYLSRLKTGWAVGALSRAIKRMQDQFRTDLLLMQARERLWQRLNAAGVADETKQLIEQRGEMCCRSPVYNEMTANDCEFYHQLLNQLEAGEKMTMGRKIARNYVLSPREGIEHVHPQPERTAWRACRDDREYQIFKTRETMARSIRSQERCGHHLDDWHAIEPLSDGEGHQGQPEGVDPDEIKAG